MRRASAGDLPRVSTNQLSNLQATRLKGDQQKQSTGCFGCLSKRNAPKGDVCDETLNNAKQKEKVEMDSFHTCTDAPSDGNDFSLSKNLHSNIINNLNNLDLVDSFQKETPILNSIVEKPDAAQSECTSKTRDALSRDARHPIAEAEVRRSESAEKLLPLRPDGSSKQDNTDRLTTDSGIDLISSPPYPQTENIYDSVRHFNSRRWKPPEKQETRRKREEDVEFLHKIGNDLIMEMESENLDVIHFEGYRTAQKLNYVRQKLKLHHVDIYQVMGAFNHSTPHQLLTINDLYELSGKLYSSQQQQQQHLNSVSSSTLSSESQSKISTLLVAWLLHVYDVKRSGRVERFSCKVALSSVCVGPLFEKLKYIFKDLQSDDGGLTKESLSTYLQSVLSLPASLSARRSSNSSLMLSLETSMDKFLDEMVRGEVPSCLGWLQILHNLIRAEQVIHAVECASCHVTNFSGFLYKCLECPNYLMCQSCFWRGFTSEGHTVQHKVKEIITPKSAPDEPGKVQNTSWLGGVQQGRIVSDLPGSPLSSINGFFQPWTSANNTGNKVSMISMEESLSGGRRRRVIPLTSEDDEHKLISRYVHRLKCIPLKTENIDPVLERQNLVFELEAKNREIQKEIHRLKCHQMRDRRSATLMSDSDVSDDQLDPNLLKEIRLLRQHQGDLDARIKGLQGSRRGLMQQLEGLMRKLKTQSSLSPSVSSPRSYCDSPAFTYPSNHHSLPHQPIPPFLHQQQSFPPSSYNSPSARFPHQPFQTPKTRLLPQSSPKSPGLDPVNYSMGSEFHQAFAFPSPSNVQGFQNVGLRQDLLMATDKVTDAVSSLVLELNTEESSDSEQEKNAAALKSPVKKASQRTHATDAMRVSSSPSMNPRLVGGSEEPTDLKRGGSLRENDVVKHGRMLEKGHQPTGRQGVSSEGELNTDLEHKFHSRSLEMEEESNRKWEGPKRRWSNR